jgi:hypothetical protein
MLVDDFSWEAAEGRRSRPSSTIDRDGRALDHGGRFAQLNATADEWTAPASRPVTTPAEAA